MQPPQTRPVNILKHPLSTLLAPLLLTSSLVAAQEVTPDTKPDMDGDIGIGVNHNAQIGHSNSSAANAIPYANFDYGNVFARVDTFGYRLNPVAYGNVEMVARYIGEGYTPLTPTGDLSARHTSVPVGLGTLQITPLGAVILNTYHDMNKSGGNLADMIFAEQWESAHVALYPQAGAEYRSRNYVRYFYGVSPEEASQFKLRGYAPDEATNLFAALFTEWKVSGNWYVNSNLRRTWLDTSVSDSPLVQRRVANSGFLALSYRFAL